MRRLVLGNMLDALERFAALLATVLVGRHGSAPSGSITRVDSVSFVGARTQAGNACAWLGASGATG
jgi:hypothetical protein